jgi:hypothetical protein
MAGQGDADEQMLEKKRMHERTPESRGKYEVSLGKLKCEAVFNFRPRKLNFRPGFTFPWSGLEFPGSYFIFSSERSALRTGS